MKSVSKIVSAAVVTSMIAGALVGCAAAPEETTGKEESANTAGIVDGTPEAAAIIKLVNEASLQSLVDDAKISELAAVNIDSYRKGDDELVGTEDDQRFESLAELDAIPSVGPSVFSLLLAHTRVRPPAVLSGTLSYPAEFVPAMRIVALKTDGSKYFKVETPSSHSAQRYAVAVDPGTYYLVAYHIEDLAGGYTNAVPCGMTAGCTDYFLASVSVTEGEIKADINPSDFGARRVPVEPLSPKSFGCGAKNYGGACRESVEGPGAPVSTLTWCEGNILRSKRCASSQRCAWESDAVGFNCISP